MRFISWAGEKLDMTIAAVAKGSPLVLAGLLLAYGPTAVAQIGPAGESAQQDLSTGAAQDLFERDRSVSVSQRPHPELQSPPHRLGAFEVQPQLDVTGEYNDNIYALNTAQTSDAIVHARPSIYAESTWSRHFFSLYAADTVNRYVSHGSENTNDWQINANGRLDIVRGANLAFGADTGLYTEPRTSAVSNQSLSTTPIRYQQSNAFVAGVRQVNRIRLSLRGDWRDFAYRNGVDATGSTVPEEDRDRSVKSVLVRGDYALSPATAVFLQAVANRRDYRVQPPVVSVGRNSSGQEILGGINFEFTDLLRGELAGGYIRQNFKDPQLQALRGPGLHGQMEWFPTPLTTLTFSAVRSIEDSGIAGTAGYFDTNFNLRVDHELLRSLILTAQGVLETDAFRGIDRTDRRLELGAGATYLMNRRLGWTLRYSHLRQSSRGSAPGATFDVNRITLGLTAHL